MKFYYRKLGSIADAVERIIPLEAVRQLLRDVLSMFRDARTEKKLNWMQIAERSDKSRQQILRGITSFVFLTKQDGTMIDMTEKGVKAIMDGAPLFEKSLLMGVVASIYIDESKESLGGTIQSFYDEYDEAKKEIELWRASQNGSHFEATTDEIDVVLSQRELRSVSPVFPTHTDDLGA